MATKRYVRRDPEGEWDVLREGDRRSSIRLGTKEEAVRRARDIVRKSGGGEVVVLNDLGKIQDSRTVPRGAKKAARRKMPTVTG